MTSRADYELRKEFCKDLCEGLVIKDDYQPVYPLWAIKLALHMTRLGWTKRTEGVTIEPSHGSQKTDKPKNEIEYH